MSPQKPAAESIRDKLTAEQYRVTQESGTERAFTGEFWDKFEKGIYVDVVTGVRYCINSAALRFVPYEKWRPRATDTCCTCLKNRTQTVGSSHARN